MSYLKIPFYYLLCLVFGIFWSIIFIVTFMFAAPLVLIPKLGREIYEGKF